MDITQLLTPFHFLRPIWLWALVPVAIIILLLFQESKAKEGWRSSVAAHLLPYLMIPGDRTSKLPRFFLVGVLVLMVLALAGPAWQKVEKPGAKTQAALVIVMDISRSMLAEDIQPSRLERAKQKVSDLLKARPGAGTALIAYAGTAHLVLPFAADYNAVNYQLESLRPDIMPVQGTRLEAALQLADSLLKPIEAPGTILVISDDVSAGDIEFLSVFQSTSVHRIEFMALGTERGAAIPLGRGRFVQDKSGNIVIPKLDLANLKKLAAIAGVKVTTVTLDDSDVRCLAANIRRNLEFSKDPEAAEEDWEDAGIWLLFPIALIALFWFRRGWMVQWVLILALPFFWGCSGESGPVAPGIEKLPENWEFIDLWLTRDQQGQGLFDEGKFAEAAERFENPLWKGFAYYRNGDFEDAAAAFSLIPTAEGFYNLGMAYAEMERWANARDAFTKALEINPDFREARENRDYVIKIIEERKQRFQTPTSMEDRMFGRSEENEELRDMEGGEDEQTEGGKNKPEEDLAQQMALQPPPGDRMMPMDNQMPMDKEQARELVLRQLSDDPAIFLKRKFQYQITARKQKPVAAEEKW
jgi:Ca-activated chloride channel family protein